MGQAGMQPGMRIAGLSSMPISRGSVTTDRLRVKRLDTGRFPREHLISVDVIDERQLVADALTAMLGADGRFRVTACALAQTNAAAIVGRAPDLVLVGVGGVRGDALRLVGTLSELAPEIRTVLVAESQDPELIRCVVDHGVAALVLTDSTGKDLAVILDQVLRGHTALPAGWQRTLAGPDQDPVAGLSERQLEVLQLLAEGCTYDEISARLIITVNTVKFHVRSIYLRLGVSNRMAAAKLLEHRQVPTLSRTPQTTLTGG